MASSESGSKLGVHETHRASQLLIQEFPGIIAELLVCRLVASGATFSSTLLLGLKLKRGEPDADETSM